MMRKKISLLLSILFVFTVVLSVVGCNKEDEKKPNDIIKDTSVSILTDRKFKRGFTVRGLGEPIYPEHVEEETYIGDKFNPRYKFQYGKDDLLEPEWKIAQWSTRYPFHNPEITTFTTVEPNVFEYKNKSKYWKVNTNTGEIELGLKASECYVYGDRVAGQEWPHLLLERDISNAKNPLPATKISDKKEIRAQAKAQLIEFKDKMTVKADLGVHSAMLIYYVFIANRDPITQVYNDMIWFGIPVFDNRYEFVEQANFVDTGSKGSATEKYIYNMGGDEFLSKDNNFWKDGKMVVGENSPWVNVDVDILPYIKTSLERAKAEDCMKESSYENLYINGMYIGYELPGTYDIKMKMKDIDIRVVA